MLLQTVKHRYLEVSNKRKFSCNYIDHEEETILPYAALDITYIAIVTYVLTLTIKCLFIAATMQL